MTYRVGIKVPFLDFKGDFDVDAKLLAAPIKTTGSFEANASK